MGKTVSLSAGQIWALCVLMVNVGDEWCGWHWQSVEIQNKIKQGLRQPLEEKKKKKNLSQYDSAKKIAGIVLLNPSGV